MEQVVQDQNIAAAPSANSAEHLPNTNLVESAESNPQDVPADIPDNVPDDIPDNVPVDIPDNVPADIPDNLRADIPDNVPADIPDNVPVDIPDNVPADIPDNVPADIPDNVPADIPDNVPADIPDNVPADIPDNLRADIPDNVPDEAPDDIPDNIPDNVPDDIPDEISKHIPEDCSSNRAHYEVSSTTERDTSASRIGAADFTDAGTIPDGPPNSATTDSVLSTSARRKIPQHKKDEKEQRKLSWWSGLVLGLSWGLAVGLFGIAYYLMYGLQPMLMGFFEEFDIKDSFKELFVDLGMIFTSPGYGYTEARDDIILFLEGTLMDIGRYFVAGGISLIIGGTTLSIHLNKLSSS